MSRHLISISKEARLDAHAQCIPIDYNVNGKDESGGKDHRYMISNNYFGTDGVITHLQFFHSTLDISVVFTILSYPVYILQ